MDDDLDFTFFLRHLSSRWSLSWNFLLLRNSKSLVQFPNFWESSFTVKRERDRILYQKIISIGVHSLDFDCIIDNEYLSDTTNTQNRFHKSAYCGQFLVVSVFLLSLPDER